MAKVKHTKKGSRKRHWFSQDTPHQLATACQSLQPFFTSQQIAGVTGLPLTHVQKTLSVWKKVGFIEIVGDGKRDQVAKSFYLYGITSAFEKQLKEVDAKRSPTKKAKVQPIELAPSLDTAIISKLRHITKEFAELGKILG